MRARVGSLVEGQQQGRVPLAEVHVSSAGEKLKASFRSTKPMPMKV